MSAESTYSEKETYTKEELYGALTAMDSRSRTDILYHCRSAADEMEKEIQTLKTKGDEGSADIAEMSGDIAVLRSIQSIAHRADEDVKALG